MSSPDELSSRLRAAVSDLRTEPVRPKRVERLARQRAAVATLGLAVIGVALVLAISGGLLAGKAAVDPTYHPPFTQQHARLVVRFVEPHAARGHIRLDDFLASSGQASTGLSREQLRSQGFAFSIRMELTGYRRSRTQVRWSVLDAGDRHQVAIPLRTTALTIVPQSTDELIDEGVWIPYPPRSGTFIVRFRLVDVHDRTIAAQDSAPFVAIRPDLFRRYRTLTYAADVPAKWKLTQDYGVEADHRRVTLIQSPSGQLLDIDTHLDWHGHFDRSAQNLERAVSQERGYRRLVLQRESLGVGAAVEWSFRLGDIYKTDIFLKRGPDGFAVLAVGSARDYTEMREIAREVARSIRPISR